MNHITELLQDADPIRNESPQSPEKREAQRRAVLAVGTGEHAERVSPRSRAPLFAMIAAIVIVGLFVGERLWSPVVQEVHAAVRFEIRLAEDGPGPGLSELKLPGTDRSIYLHEETIVTNGDISSARVIHVGDAYTVGIEFNSTGAKKMREATANHIGKPIAILLDGQVVMVPVLRLPIDASAEISDGFTKAEAERVANGIIGRP